MEITERLFLSDSKRVSTVLRELQALGIRLAIDDFGAGYASIGHLRRYPIHQLKIDKTFVDHVTDNPDDAAIARAMIALSQSMHLETVAEGVETGAQLAFFVRHECDTMQGYLFSPALPASRSRPCCAKPAPCRCSTQRKIVETAGRAGPRRRPHGEQIRRSVAVTAFSRSSAPPGRACSTVPAPRMPPKRPDRRACKKRYLPSRTASSGQSPHRHP